MSAIHKTNQQVLLLPTLPGLASLPVYNLLWVSTYRLIKLNWFLQPVHFHLVQLCDLPPGWSSQQAGHLIFLLQDFFQHKWLADPVKQKSLFLLRGIRVAGSKLCQHYPVVNRRRSNCRSIKKERFFSSLIVF